MGKLLAVGGIAVKGLGDIAAKVTRAKPDFLIIGTQKAGTTSLHAYLSEHPQISASYGPKELHFFNLYYDRGLRWYLSHFPSRRKKDRKLWFEATPDYLWHEDVPARIKEAVGRPKLIAVIRDPAERAYSAWNMWNSFAARSDRDPKRADLRSFPDAIKAELACPSLQKDLHFHYVEMGHYAAQLERWTQCFGRESLLILDHSQMEDDLPSFMARICEFLEIAPWTKEAVESFARRRHWVGPRRERSEADEATIRLLDSYYAEHDERLALLLGRTPSWRT